MYSKKTIYYSYLTSVNGLHGGIVPKAPGALPDTATANRPLLHFCR
jgi:hypothetical protein